MVFVGLVLKQIGCCPKFWLNNSQKVMVPAGKAHHQFRCGDKERVLWARRRPDTASWRDMNGTCPGDLEGVELLIQTIPSADGYRHRQAHPELLTPVLPIQGKVTAWDGEWKSASCGSLLVLKHPIFGYFWGTQSTWPWIFKDMGFQLAIGPKNWLANLPL